MRRGFAWVRVTAVTLAAVALGGAFACGTDPVGVETCRRIEFARCENAPACNVSLERPVHRGDSPSDDVGACKRYYDTACLHGLAAPTDPGGPQVQACVDAINTGPCEWVVSPELAPACAFLVPPAPPPPPPADAAADVDVDGG